MGAAKSLFRLIDSRNWTKVEEFLLDKDIGNETKIENLRFRDKYKGNPLNIAIYNKAPIFIIVLMVDIGGEEMLEERDNDGSCSLHHAVIAGSSVNLLTLITRVAGGQVLTGQDSRGKIPLHHCVDRYNEPDLASFKCLLKEGMLYGIGGKYGLGGIFIGDKLGHSTFDFLINRFSWGGNIVQALNETVRGEPLLHGAIGNVTKENLKEIITNFPWSVITYDNHGRLPIHVAAESGLTWDHGVDLLVNAKEEFIEAIDTQVTGLYPFLIAAAEDNNDLNTVFHLLQRSLTLLPLRSNQN